MIEAIRARQIQAEEGKQNSLTIFPEGGTTNGEYIIKFKKGAFVTLRAVQPYYISQRTITGIRANCGTGLQSMIFLVIIPMLTGLTDFCLHELPVFEPNEYFWANHWDGKEEKWEAYARAMQQIMVKVSGLRMSDHNIEDKLVYREILKRK